MRMTALQLNISHSKYRKKYLLAHSSQDAKICNIQAGFQEDTDHIRERKWAPFPLASILKIQT